MSDKKSEDWQSQQCSSSTDGSALISWDKKTACQTDTAIYWTDCLIRNEPEHLKKKKKERQRKRKGRGRCHSMCCWESGTENTWTMWPLQGGCSLKIVCLVRVFCWKLWHSLSTLKICAVTFQYPFLNAGSLTPLSAIKCLLDHGHKSNWAMFKLQIKISSEFIHPWAFGYNSVLQL